MVIYIPGGFYMTCDGPDGCGKSTQMSMLAERFRKKYDVVLVREPGDTIFGNDIRDILLDIGNNLCSRAELFLFEAARAQLCEEKIRPALEEGKIVLSDRSKHSSTAYQGYAGKLGVDVIERMNEIVTRGVVPDLEIFIDIDPTLGLEKEGSPDRFAAKGFDYHQRVREGFLDIVRRNPRRVLIKYRDGDEDGMHDEIYRIAKAGIDEKLKRASNS